MTSKKRAQKFHTDDASLLVPLIGLIKFPTRHDQSEALPIISRCMVTRHRNGISALLSQTSFGRETSGSVVYRVKRVKYPKITLKSMSTTLYSEHFQEKMIILIYPT